MTSQNNHHLFTETKRGITATQCFTSLTTVKKMVETIELNQEAVSPLTCKKLLAVSITPEVIREKIRQILYESHLSASQQLLKCLEGWIGAEWKQHRIGMINRITKLKYLYPSLFGENYNKIEKEISIEWKKNSFLHGCQLLWNHVFRTSKFKNLQELNQFYQIIRELVAHISFILFEPPLQALRQQKFPVQHRLFNITSVTIITSSKEWKSIVQKIIKPHLFQFAPSFSENFDLRSLKVPAEIIDFKNRTDIFHKTAISIANLSKSYTLSEIVGTLKSYRQNMINDVRTNIGNWQIRNGKSSRIIMEKDDILACLIYSLVAYKLDEVGVALQYVRFLLNNELQNILRQFKVDCYLTDLQGVYQYLTSPVVQVSLQQLQVQQQTKQQMISA